MKQRFTISTVRKRHARLVRAVAVFFVLFTLCDIALPQYFCGGGEEVGGLPLHLSATAEAGDRSDGFAPEAPSPEQGSEQAPHEEDCFCCCAHVLAGLAITPVASAELRSQQPPLELSSLPSPTLPLQYHPPRIA